MSWDRRARTQRVTSRRRTSLAQIAFGVARNVYGAARDVTRDLAILVGGGLGAAGGHHLSDSDWVKAVTTVGGAFVASRLHAKATSHVGRAIGPEISGGDTNTLQNALNYAARSADKTAGAAEPALAMVDRIMATLEQAGGRQPPREIKDALQDLEDARKLLEDAAELGRSASADIDSVMYEIFST